MRPGGVGLCAALSLVVATVRDEDEVEVEVVWSGGVPRCASPGLALACSARICVARQGCLLHTMQTGRGTVEYGTELDMCMSPSQPVHSSSLSGASTGYGSNCQDVRSTQRCRNVGSRSTGGASPHFARGRSQEGPVQVPNRLAHSSPAGVPFCPGLPGTSAPLAGQAPSCFRSSQCLSPNIF